MPVVNVIGKLTGYDVAYILLMYAISPSGFFRRQMIYFKMTFRLFSVITHAVGFVVNVMNDHVAVVMIYLSSW